MRYVVPACVYAACVAAVAALWVAWASRGAS
jgi:hypothetical protein